MTVPPNRHRSRAFTLIELLVVIAVVAVLISILLPALGRARETAQSAACLSNLRQIHLSAQAYASQSNGLGPAIGAPWNDPPNWAIVALDYLDRGADDPYAAETVTVCPRADLAYPQTITRSYAINATGHAGLEGDPDTFDNPSAHIRFDKVRRPAETPVFLDSAIAFIPGDAPPPSRTSSTIDFRQESHVLSRIGYWHTDHRFQAVHFDGSARAHDEPEPHWTDPLP